MNGWLVFAIVWALGFAYVMGCAIRDKGWWAFFPFFVFVIFIGWPLFVWGQLDGTNKGRWT